MDLNEVAVKDQRQLRIGLFGNLDRLDGGRRLNLSPASFLSAWFAPE